MFGTIRAIFGFLNPLIFLRSNPRTVCFIVFSVGLMGLHHAWNVQLDKRVLAANARLEKAGLKQPTKVIYPAPTLPDDQNAAFQYAKIERAIYKINPSLNNRSIFNASLNPRIISQEQEILDLIRQTRGLKHEYNTHIQRFDPARLVNLCLNAATLHVMVGDIDAAVEYLIDARQILQSQTFIDPDSHFYNNYLGALQFLATQHKPGDKLKPFLSAAISELEDTTPFLIYRRDQLARQFRSTTSLYRVDAFEPLSKILYDYEVTYYITNNIYELSAGAAPKPVAPSNYNALRKYTNTAPRSFLYAQSGPGNRKWNFPKIRIAQAAIAFQLYRVDHGEFPQDARLIVPQYLPESFKKSDFRLGKATYSDNSPRPIISTPYGNNDRFLRTNPNFCFNESFADLAWQPTPPK